MMILAGFLAVAITGSTPHTTPGSAACGLASLKACDDTNQLVWTEPFDRAVRRFLGGRRAAFLDRPGLVSDQALEVLGGPPDPPNRIGSLYRFTACRAHSCPEKGAVVLEPDGRLVAVAILHATCALPHAATDCFAHDSLELYIRRPAPEGVVDDLSAWAKAEVAGEYTAPGQPAETLDAVHVTQIP